MARRVEQVEGEPPCSKLIAADETEMPRSRSTAIQSERTRRRNLSISSGRGVFPKILPCDRPWRPHFRRRRLGVKAYEIKTAAYRQISKSIENLLRL